MSHSFALVAEAYVFVFDPHSKICRVGPEEVVIATYVYYSCKPLKTFKMNNIQSGIFWQPYTKK